MRREGGGGWERGPGLGVGFEKVGVPLLHHTRDNKDKTLHVELVYMKDPSLQHSSF